MAAGRSAIFTNPVSVRYIWLVSAWASFGRRHFVKPRVPMAIFGACYHLRRCNYRGILLKETYVLVLLV
jgi:hypothetical protein